MSDLYVLQEKIWRHVFEHEERLGISNVLLCGGTALARFYLDHRVSYDLDFFVPSRFSPEALQSQLKKIGLEIVGAHMHGGDDYCRQLKGLVSDGKTSVRVDFIEDIYEGMFDVAEKNGAKTEVLDGLYHRKIRTVSGMFLKDGSIKGGRQTARDVFDLYVLGQSAEPLSTFIDRINQQGANIPLDGLLTGIISMQWIDLLDEFDELTVDDKWAHCDLKVIRTYLEKEVLLLQNLKDQAYEHESAFTF